MILYMLLIAAAINEDERRWEAGTFTLFLIQGKSTTDKLANKLNISDLFMLWPVFIVRSYIQDHLKYSLKKLKNQSEDLISVLRYYLRPESDYALKNEIED